MTTINERTLSALKSGLLNREVTLEEMDQFTLDTAHLDKSNSIFNNDLDKLIYDREGSHRYGQGDEGVYEILFVVSKENKEDPSKIAVTITNIDLV